MHTNIDSAAQAVATKTKQVKRSHPDPSLVGAVYAWLTILQFDHKTNSGGSWYLCRCKCGRELPVNYKGLTSGDNKSCGCKKAQRGRDMATHGFSRVGKRRKIYSVWSGIIQRTTNPNSRTWKHYGGRGIQVCERIRTFEGFLSVMGGENPGMTVDRKDVNGHYSCGLCSQCQREGWKLNVRWANWDTQSNNRRNNLYYTHDGKTMSLKQWADECGISWWSLYGRLITRKWDFIRAITEPVKPTPKRQSGPAC
jgi:hypothetical protein